MPVSLHLSGKVRVESVPRVAAGESRPDLVRKHLLLPQGDLIQIHNGPESFQYLAWIELKPGTLRGNHVHRNKREFLYVLAGRLDLVLQDVSTGERTSVPIQAGHWIEIPPGIAHTLCPLEAGGAIECSPGALDPADTIRHVLVPPNTTGGGVPPAG